MVTPAPDRPLRVLLTNNTLGMRAGSELFILDLARALVRRGHLPVAYSTILGPVADELRRATVPVVERLEDLTEAPDVIHGQHHLDAMTAMLRFPDTPAIFVCHGWQPWQEEPPHFPTIRRYVAVDALCRERLVTHGIPSAECSVIPNFVDLARFPSRAPLPVRPMRAAVFSNSLAADSLLAAEIRSACDDHGIVLDVLGAAAGTATGDPGRALAEYDVVFAKGRSAIESLAVGCATIVCDAAGLSGMVTMARLPSLRGLNFGLRTLQDSPVTRESVARALGDYDAADAAQVSAWMRSDADLEVAADRWVDLYRDVVALPLVPSDRHARACLAAASDYLARVSRLTKRVEAAEAASTRAEQARSWLQGEVEAEAARSLAREAELQAALAEGEGRERRARDAEAALREVMDSRTWRAAAPYRAVRARLRRG